MRIATLSAQRGAAPPCIYRGFYITGCSTNAKQGVLATWIPHALRAMGNLLEASGAWEIWQQENDTCHLNGGARMGTDPCESLVDADGRSLDIANLWACDGPVFPTVGGVNPSLTILAIACRTGDRIRQMARGASCSGRGQKPRRSRAAARVPRAPTA